MDAKRYVSVGGKDVYLVEHDPFEDYEVTIRDMILHDQIPWFSDVEEIQFAGAENYTVTREEESAMRIMRTIFIFPSRRKRRCLWIREM